MILKIRNLPAEKETTQSANFPSFSSKTIETIYNRSYIEKKTKRFHYQKIDKLYIMRSNGSLFLETLLKLMQ